MYRYPCVVDPDPHGFAIDSGRLDSDPERLDPHKRKKEEKKIMFRSAGCSLLRVGGFFLSLDVLHGGLGINILLCLIKNINFM
jgi:hypothetical protein